MGKTRSRAAIVAVSAAASALAASFVIVPGADAAAGLRFGANYKLSSNTTGRGVDVPGLAVDPSNPSHIVEANIDPVDQQCDYHVSFDGGKTWAGDHLTIPTSGATPPFPSPACASNFDSGGYAHLNTGIVFGSGQNVYITFSIHRGAFERLDTSPLTLGGAGDDSVVARSTDGGRTFKPGVVAIPGSTTNDTQPVSTRPQIAVQRGAGANGQDRLYVNAWQLFVTDNGGNRRMLVARSDDGGTTWQTPVIASARNVRGPTDAAAVDTADEIVRELSQPVIGPDGAVYAAYRSVDRVAGTTCPPNPAATPVNLQTNCIVVARSTDQGQSWTQTSTGVPLSGSTGQPRLAIDPSVGTAGKLYVVYYKPGAGSDPDDIFLQSSVDAGKTWSSPVRVNHDPPGAVQAFPQVSVGPTGQVNVIWFDRRNAYPGGGPRLGDIYFAQSTDGGATFGADRRVTDRTINRDVGIDSELGSYSFYGPVAEPLPDGGVIAAWMDSREGNLDNGFQDIYLSVLSATPGIVKSSIATATPAGLSVMLSRLAYPGGAEAAGPTTPVTRVVVANQGDVAGALAGAVLARANWGPLLLSPAGGLPAVVQADAARMVPEGAFVIGDSSMLSTTVSGQLTAVTRNGENVVRIAPGNDVAIADRSADIARQVALRMFPLPGSAPTAVIADPGTPEAASASALAAALQYPILFVDTRATLPGPTKAAIATLGVKRVLIVGGPGAVNVGVESSLVTLLGAGNVTRLGGADQYATSLAVAGQALAAGLPANVVYVADGSRPIDGALLGASVARVGGLMLLAPGASTGAAESALGGLGLDGGTDRIVGVLGAGGTDPVVAPPVRHGVVVSLAGTGSGRVSGSGIACPGTCSQSLAAGTGVSLTAVAARGSRFAGWSGACGGSGACTVALSSDLKITATFVRVPVAPRCTLRPSGRVSLRSGRLSAVVRCDQGASVSLGGVLRERLGGGARTFGLGVVVSSVRAGRSRTLALRLPAGARLGLARGAAESVRLTLTASNRFGTSHRTATIGRIRLG